MALSENGVKVIVAVVGLMGTAIGVIGTVVVARIAKEPVPVAAAAQNIGVKSGADAPEWMVQSKVDDWEWGTQWINSECRPRDLSGIELASLQKGNGQPYAFYVLCRKDSDTNARYGLRMTPKSDDVIGSIRVVLGNSNAKLGPFYFSSDGHGGAFWYVEKVQ
jgi:hypothetical protein